MALVRPPVTCWLKRSGRRLLANFTQGDTRGPSGRRRIRHLFAQRFCLGSCRHGTPRDCCAQRQIRTRPIREANVGVSIGHCLRAGACKRAGGPVSLADKALYAAKSAGLRIPRRDERAEIERKTLASPSATWKKAPGIVRPASASAGCKPCHDLRACDSCRSSLPY